MIAYADAIRLQWPDARFALNADDLSSLVWGGPGQRPSDAEIEAAVVTWDGWTSADEVVAERQRRLQAGFDFDFGDARGVVHIGTTPADMAGWAEVTQLSNALIALGQGSADIEIYPASTAVTITALEWQSILVAAGQFRQPIWLASFGIQSMDPIPADFRADSYWTGGGNA